MARNEYKEAPAFYTIRNLGVDEKASIMAEGIQYEIIDDHFSAFYEGRTIADKILLKEGESVQVRCEDGEEPMVVPVDSPSEKEEDTDVVNDDDTDSDKEENVANMLPQVAPSGPVLTKEENTPDEVIQFSESVLHYIEDPYATYDDVVEEGVMDTIINLKTKVVISYKTRKLIVKIHILKAKIKNASKKNIDNKKLIDMKRELVQLQKELNAIKKSSSAEEKSAIASIESKAKSAVPEDKTPTAVSESTDTDFEDCDVFTEVYDAHKAKHAYLEKTEKKYAKLKGYMDDLKDKDLSPEDKLKIAEEASSIISVLIVEANKIPDDGFFDGLIDINFFINGLKKIFACFKASFTITKLVIYRPRTQRSVVIGGLRKAQSELDKAILDAKRKIRTKEDIKDLTESTEFSEATAVTDKGRLNYWEQMIDATEDKISKCKDNKEIALLKSKITEYKNKISEIKADSSKNAGVRLQGKMHMSKYAVASTDDVIPGNAVTESSDLHQRLEIAQRLYLETGDVLYEKKIRGLKYMIEKESKSQTEDSILNAGLITESADGVIEEAANMENEIKPIVAELNRKGYKVKYSSPGHEKLRKKEDNEPDGVYYGKLYSDARLMFQDDYKFPAAPKYWTWRKVDNCDYLDIIPKQYNDKDGTPDEAFKKWKDGYMASLKSYVDGLPQKGSSKKEEVPDKEEDVKESVDPFEEILLSLDPTRSYMIEHTEISKGDELKTERMLITEFNELFTESDE